MSYKVHTISNFDRKFKKLAKKYKSLKDDLLALAAQLSENPYTGADLGGGVRKVRMAISDKGKGKSGGARVITYTVEVDEASGTVTLLTIYDKGERESITSREIGLLLAEAGQ